MAHIDDIDKDAWKKPKSAIVSSRISICKSCPDLTGINTCKHCGCFMPAKVRLMSSSCPIGKWGKYEKIPVNEVK